MVWLPIRSKHYLCQYTSFLLKGRPFRNCPVGNFREEPACSERSGPLAQGKGRRAQGKIVIWVVLLPAPSSLLSAFKLPFSFNINKHKNMHYQNCSLYLPIVAFFLTLNYLLPIFSNNPAFVFCLR